MATREQELNDNQNLPYVTRRRRARKEIFSCAIPADQLNLLYQACDEFDLTLSQIGREALLMWLSYKNLVPPTDLPKHLQPGTPTTPQRPEPATGVAASTFQAHAQALPAIARDYKLQLPYEITPSTLPNELGVDSDGHLDELAEQLEEDTDN